MTPLDLSVGEFGLADKIQPYEHIQGRLAALRKAYAVNPEVAREVISYAWPHAQNRPWTHDEIHERLGITPQAIVAEKAAEDASFNGGAGWRNLATAGGVGAGAGAGLGAGLGAVLGGGSGAGRGALLGGALGGLYSAYRQSQYAPRAAQASGFAVANALHTGASMPEAAAEHNKTFKPQWWQSASLAPTDDILRTPRGFSLRSAHKVAEVFLKGAAAQFVQQHFPAFGAAFDAFEATRAQQEAMDADRQRVAYPAMHFTQPLMASYASGETPAPSHHHRRHHHG